MTQIILTKQSLIHAVATTGNPQSARLEYVERDAPSAGAETTILDVHLAGVNFVDILHARGTYPVPPHTVLGFEGVGTAPDGKRYAVVDQKGFYAERVAVPNSALIPLPDDIDDDAAMLLFQGITAQYLSTSVHPLRAGETALVFAAAGGVGWSLMHLIRAAGARPIGVVSSEAKASVLHERGFEAIAADGAEAGERARALVPDGVDVVFDANGKSTWPADLAAVRTRGHIVLYGLASGPVDPIDPSVLLARSLTLSSTSIFDHMATPEERNVRAGAIFAALRTGALQRPPIHHFPLERAADAHALLESRGSIGKVVLECSLRRE